MQYEILLNGQNTRYILKTRKNSKNLRITVKEDSSVVVSAPRRVSLQYIEQFIHSKREWILNKQLYFSEIEKTRPKIVGESKANYKQLKTQALELVVKKSDHFNTFYNYTIGKITVRNQKTRWGSCSRRGNLNFNYKIALLPEHLADYIVVHEICHLEQFNHSQKFWDLVALTIPNYQECRKELRLLRL